MASLFLLIPSTLLLVLLILRVTRWTSNYIAARKIGLPILLSPFSWQEPLYMLLGSHLSFLRHLPFGLGAWTQYSLLGWPLHSSYHLHHKLGPAFTIVSPAKNEITVADPVAAEELLSKYKVWTKPSELYEIFNVFGKNVNSVNGEDWQRHRKITGTTFKESNYRIVWDESVKQAGQMCKVWEKAEEITLRRVIDDFALLAMHVLAMGGFGKEYDFDGTGLDEVEAGHQISYGTAMKTILLNVMSVVLFSGLKAPSWLLPKSLKELQVATKDFKKYLAERVADERKSAEKGEIKDNLMSMLVRANEAAKNEDGARMVLSDDELYGNLFIFNLAGYETTAGTLVYALSLLAAFPDVQNWVMEEVDSNTERIQKGNYDEAFPKLVRCLAVMYETLRHYSSAQGLAKSSGDSSLPLQIGSHHYVVPPQTFVTVNFGALHLNPDNWGEDAGEYRPQRWVSTNEKTGKETLTSPPEGAGFVAWSHGPRICPGKKFSHVEFVSVLASMLKDYRIEPASRGREQGEEARARLLGAVRDSVFNMTPKPRRPNDAGLMIVKR